MGISKPQRASVVLVVDCTERERERRRSVGRPYRRGCGRTPSTVGGRRRRTPLPSLHLLPSLARLLLSTPPQRWPRSLPAGRSWSPASSHLGVLALAVRRGPLLVESWAELRIGNSLADGGSERVHRPAGGQAPAPLTLDTAGRGTASEALSSTDATRTRSPSLLPFTGFYNDPLERVKQMRTPTWSAARFSDSRRAATAAQTAAGQA